MVALATKRKSEWFEWLKAIATAVIIALLIQNFVFATSIVEGDSMEPTLENGERLIFNKMIYLLNEPKRGDIIIIQQTDKNYVKRIIALPGETVEIRNSELYIDGERYIETFLSEEISSKTGEFGPIDVPQDSYFVMGDNRAISKDSRNGLGFIQREEIIGRSELIIYPISEWGRTK
ncbi:MULTISPECIES: signal peptidase I [unclassified Oceanobacillus]|uniref:signal peptidase I n=1 Tax=unclassified Oceanobacillus TaxID=2630292 RepID=UPI0012EC9C22|nr:signal peptidase I [Oceanobacillus sp. AG]